MDKEIAFLNLFINVVGKMYHIYLALAQAEKNNMTHDASYTTLLMTLNDLYEQEKILLNKISRDFNKINELSLIILVNYDKLTYPSDDENEIEIISSRILRHLEIMEDNIEENMPQLPSREEYEDDEECDYEQPETFLENAKKKNFEIEFYKRLQQRIDNATEDKELLIDEKYNMLFSFPLLGADMLCTAFNLDNISVTTNSAIATQNGTSQSIYEIKYLLYMREIVYSTIEKLIFNEKYEDEPDSRRVNFKLYDLQLELALSYFGFINLYELKEDILTSIKNRGMEKSLTYILVKENFDEAINYACNYSRKLETKPTIKIIKPGHIRVQVSGVEP